MKPSESKKARAKNPGAGVSAAPVAPVSRSTGTSVSAKIWGLTGGIASGKSTVARIFSELGVPVLDADQVARELRAPDGAAYDAIVARFGTADAQRLREIVFANPVARSELEAILHPLIRAESARRIEAMAASYAKTTAANAKIGDATPIANVASSSNTGSTTTVPVIYEATLLVETGRYRDFAGLIVVSADESVRLARLMARDSHPEDLARRIVESQIDDEKRRAVADFVIKNHGSLEDLRAQVMALLPKLQ
jgi:dephospho-CoA kinase